MSDPIHNNSQEIDGSLLQLFQENFTNYFRSYLSHSTGIPYSGNIIIDNLNFGGNLGPNNNFEQLLVILRTSSGSYSIPFIVRRFESSQIVEMAPLATAVELTSELLLHEPIVLTPKLLYFSHAHLTMVFEGLPSEIVSFSLSPLNPSLRFYLAGRALAPIHGTDFYQIDHLHYRRREYSALNRLPILLEENKKELEYLLKANERSIRISYGGTQSYGNYSPDSVCIPQHDNINLDQNSPQIYLIDPSSLTVDVFTHDRMEDIANFFSWSILANFAVGWTGFDRTSIEDLLKQVGIDHFLKGYDDFFRAKTTIEVTDLYGEAHTLGYHLALKLLEMIPSGLKNNIITEEQILNLIEGVKGLLQVRFVI